MMKKNKWKLMISSVVILLPIFIELCLPEFTFNGNNGMTGSKMFFVFGIPLFLLSIHWMGIFLTVHDPKNINGLIGYRTSRSMRNMDTWNFAHECNTHQHIIECDVGKQISVYAPAHQHCN